MAQAGARALREAAAGRQRGSTWNIGPTHAGCGPGGHRRVPVHRAEGRVGTAVSGTYRGTAARAPSRTHGYDRTNGRAHGRTTLVVRHRPARGAPGRAVRAGRPPGDTAERAQRGRMIGPYGGDAAVRPGSRHRRGSRMGAGWTSAGQVYGSGPDIGNQPYERCGAAVRAPNRTSAGNRTGAGRAALRAPGRTSAGSRTGGGRVGPRGAGGRCVRAHGWAYAAGAPVTRG